MTERLELPMTGGTIHCYILNREALALGGYMFRYTVIGSSAFPWDMLRLDTSYPADTDSAMKLGNAPAFGSRGPLLGIVLNCRSTNRNWQPTFDRWRSFGWVVATTAWERNGVKVA